MAEFERVSGFDSYDAGTLWTTAQHDTFLITVQDANPTAIDLRNEDGTAADQAVETIMKEVAPLVYYVDNDASGQIHVVVDGHHTSAESLQTRIRNLGTAVGPNSVDVSGTTVTLGTAIAVS